MNHYAVDFETYYDAEVGIKTLGAWAYLRHPLCVVYLVSIYGPEIDYVGPPADAPWDKIAGQHWVSHNEAFDGLVYQRLIEQRLIPHLPPSAWFCTANLSVYMGAQRNLKAASKALLNLDASKEYRKIMKGKLPEDLTPEQHQIMIDAGRQDASFAWRLWASYAPQWPQVERDLAELTTEMGWHGLHIDQARVAAGIKTLQQAMWKADQEIPWAGELDAKGLEVARLSPIRLAAECLEAGIPPPASVAQDSEECEEWLDTFGEAYPWVMALRTYRRCNALLRKLEVMVTRIQPNGRMGYGLKYFGAHTGRWSGDSGWNPQNLTKGENFGVDLRACIVPAPGKKFIIWDLSQIEPRSLAWLVKDTKFLKLCATGMSPYEAHARASMNWKGGKLKDENSQLYALSKARVLALGFGSGFLKFITMAKKYGVDGCFNKAVEIEDVLKFQDWLDSVDNKDWLTLFENASVEQRAIYVNSWLIVQDFRATNRKIVNFWRSLDSTFKRSVKDGKFIVSLPSGRKMYYRQISCAGGSWTAQVQRNGPREKYYGGKLCENITQATARDVFAAAKLRLRDAGFQIVLTVHDEAVLEVDPSVTCAEIRSIVEQPVPWMEGCPIACEAHEAMQYGK